jgi:ATP synthase in type III secretion protein N
MPKDTFTQLLLNSGFAPSATFGKCTKVNGLVVEVQGIQAAVGELLEFVNADGRRQRGEVLALRDERLLACPYQGVRGMSLTTRVYPLGQMQTVPVGWSMLGRVFDSLGMPIDNLPVPQDVEYVSIDGVPPSPMTRETIGEVLHTGIRAIDGMLTIGVGQRIGVFAPAGGGKSTLLGMLTRGVSADVIVLALVGERGREVREFVEDVLGKEGLSRAVVFVATADRHAVERSRCAAVATAAAEYFRDQGKNVLLMVDSVTRFGRAQRELGLALGEPPTRRGYPPSLFAALPQLFERAGRSALGSITGIYTVLMEDEDSADPLAEEVRSLLDGHIVLSRQLAEKAHFPAIAVDQSLSRLASRLISRTQSQDCKRFREFLSKQKELEMLVRMGEYREGSDLVGDAALASHPKMTDFLQQSVDKFTGWDDTLLHLSECVQSDV